MTSTEALPTHHTIGDITAAIRSKLEQVRNGKSDVDIEHNLSAVEALLLSAERLAIAQADAIATAVEHGVDLLEAKVRAEQTSKVKSDFLTCMSHELRTPLHAMLTLAQLGVRKGETITPKKAHQYFKKIEISGRALHQLVGNLLDLSQIETGHVTLKRCSTDLSVLTEEVVAEFETLLRENEVCAELRTNLHSPVEVDDPKLRQVLRNLIGNALKFSPKGGRLHLAWEQSADSVRFLCRDEGPGIAKEDRDKVFERFGQASVRPAHVPGTGLGLTIAQEIVALHAGRIWVDNHAKGGAVFYVELPTHVTSD